MSLTGLGEAFAFGSAVINKIFPDPAQRAQAQQALTKLAQDGELEPLRLAFSAIVAEAQSRDPFTSRARPAFLYVVYIYLLAAIPIGVLSIFAPEAATQIANGVKAWLAAIPGELYALFGTGYLGYGVYRTIDKRTQQATGEKAISTLRSDPRGLFAAE